VSIGNYLLVELVDAAVRCGETAAANDALAQLVERATASGTDTALGMAARSMALVTNGATADALMPRTARPSRTCSAAPSPSIWHAPTWSKANGCVA